MKINRLLLDPGGDGGGGNTPPAFDIKVLPADLQAEPSLAQFKNVVDLAKSYVSAQKMVGADKVALPGKNSTPEQLAEFYTKLGRPAEADKYSQAADLKLADGLDLKPEVLGEIKKQFHTLGLSKTQGDALLTYYLGEVNKDFTNSRAAQVTAQAAATGALKDEWKDKFDANMDTAKGVLRKFAAPEAIQELEASGLGNNPALIKMLHKIGAGMLEDHAGGEGDTLPVGTAAAAVAEINRLKMDTEFMKTLANSGPGHTVAVDRWYRLHQSAYPNKQQEP